LQLGHNYIGTEHILLGLIREGEGVAAQVLVRLGADLSRVRQQVIQLLHRSGGQEPVTARATSRPGLGRGERELLSGVIARIDPIDSRLSAIEQRVGTGPDLRDLDQEIAQINSDKQAAAADEDYENAAALRDRERHLLAERASRQQEWAAAHPDLPALAVKLRQLSDEVDRLRALLGQHDNELDDGLDDGTA